MLAVATSSGSVELHAVQGGRDGAASLKYLRSIPTSEDGSLALSLAWCPRLDKKNVLAVTLSNGALVLVDVSSDLLHGGQSVLANSNTHTLEAWTCAWGQSDGLPDIYSGGDDSILARQQLFETSEDRLILRVDDNRTHEAGVTAILPLSDGYILTGSYDEYVRVLQPPGLQSPSSHGTKRRWKCPQDLRLGGGVWRLKVMGGRRDRQAEQARPEDTWLVLVSCMHAGARILRIIKAEEWSIKIVASFEEHESMNYGSDFIACSGWKNSAPEDGFVVVSTSFYDKRLCVWRCFERSSPDWLL